MAREGRGPEDPLLVLSAGRPRGEGHQRPAGPPARGRTPDVAD